ncbi:MAG TPA: hypothetical protein VGN15_12110, partial [Ktedonobacteraceae bacterium]|nr:hypothetical protein [Ktedonobacteraceae bacterium]
MTFEAVDEVVPPAALTPEDAKVQRDVNQQHMERNFEHEVMRQDQPMFDPEIGDTQTMSDVAAAKEEAQTEKEVAAESAPQPVVPVDATPLEKTQVQFRSQQEELSQKLNDFDQSLRRAATAGHEDVKVLTGQMDGLVNQIMKSFDFTHGEKAPQEWWNNVSRQIDAIGVQYDRIGQSITDLVGGEEANARIGAAVDVSSEANRQAQLVNLDDRERAIADVLHHYYQTTGMLGKRMNVLKSLMEHFLPHVIERGPNGNKIQSITSGRLSDNTMHAIARVVDKDTGEILYKTIQELQKRLNEVGDGAVVKTDLGQIFAAHGKGLTQAMLLRQFVTRAATDLEAQVHSNGFQARPVATRAYLRRLPPEIAKFYREVKMGPMVKVLQPDQFGGHPQYLVYSPLAERMERLASSYDMGGKVVSVAQKLNTMNAWFKQYKFVSPMHAWSMMSNLQVQSGGKLGLLGVPGVVDPKVWGLMHNGNKIYKDSLMLNRAVASGWTKPDMNVP